MASVGYAYQTSRGDMMRRNHFATRAFDFDYRPSNFYEFEMVGESDARSQRIEMCQGQWYVPSETASEDSCSLRRNKMNTTTSDTNFVGGKSNPTVSHMSRAERKQLRKDLKSELFRVQSLITRLEARELDLRSFYHMPELDNNGSSSKSVCEPMQTHGDYSEIKGVGHGLTKPKVKGGVKRAFHLNSELQHSKRAKSEIDSKKLADIMRQCSTILKKLKAHKFGWVFKEPVDFVALKIPDYPLIIKHPMDLGTIQTKLEMQEYESPLEFAADVRLTFANAMKFNPKGHDVHIMAESLRNIFENRWKTIDKKIKQLNLHFENVITVSNERETQRTYVSAELRVNDRSKQKRSHQMTDEERQALSTMLEEVPSDKLDQVLEILRRKDPDVKPVDNEVTIDIESLDSDSLWELYELLKRPTVAIKSVCEEFKEQNISKQAFPMSGHQVEIPVDDVDAKDEEVDIGEETPANYAPIEIGKDSGVCSSPSSSSSSGSSSSSDSDSGSSSESDSDAGNPEFSGAQVTPRKEPVGSAAVCEPNGNPTPKMNDAKRNLSDFDEELSLTRATVCDEDTKQPAEDKLPESQVSEKFLRAALLKNRFADTILKAREKTMPSGFLSKKCTDPEKVRKEREELERIQREEKARLQAEAKAAEDSRKRAEAEAVAKAKLEREAERQAARLVLQQMEKTVEIDGNADYLKDLELLGAAPSDIPMISHDQSSHSQDVAGFGFNYGNPLERLGLFMKMDEEEDQETAATLNDSDAIDPDALIEDSDPVRNEVEGIED